MKLFKRCLAVSMALATLAALATVSTPASAQVSPAIINPTCAFPIIVNQQDANVAYPDTNSTYWAMPTHFSLLTREVSTRFLTVSRLRVHRVTTR